MHLYKILILVVLCVAFTIACSDDDADPGEPDVKLTYDVPLQEGAYWPKFRRDAANTGLTPVKPGKGQDKVWSFQTGKVTAVVIHDLFPVKTEAL